MISRSEQQFIIKLHDKVALEKEYRKDVHSKERMAVSGVFDFNSENILKDINRLGVDCVCNFEEGIWEITLGGKATKKKVNMKGEELDMIMAKSLIIYARKYL